MTLFDLLFLALALAAALALLAAAWAGVRGRLKRAGRLLGALLTGAAVYMAIVIAVSLVLPRRVVARGADECFDDWCIGVADANRSDDRAGAVYDVGLRLHNRARRVSQRERNLHVYLEDEAGRRYEAQADGSAAPFDVLLAPGDSIRTVRRFVAPAGVRHAGLVITHEGGFPIGWLIIGYDTWFRKPAIVPLD